MSTSTTTAEPPLTLDQPPVRTLGFGDQLALWFNLGVSILLLPVAGLFYVEGMSLLAALVAIAVGTLIGNLLLGVSTVPGAHTGAPAMVLFRGLFGRYGSYVPTVLNLAQCLGWATFEILVIAEAADYVVDGDGQWWLVVIAGVAATAMAVRPLAVVHALKRYVVWLALASTVYLFVEVIGDGLPGLTDGNWTGFWPAVDLVAALSVSWMPLAADYSRQSKSAHYSFWGAFLGYASSSWAFFTLGVLVVAVFGSGDVIGSLVAVPAGALALGILAVDEIDEAFANIYSTAVSAQNIAPRIDRRALAVAIGAIATLLALLLDMHEYEKFLLLIGSVFVPLYAVLIVEYFHTRRRVWDVSEGAPARPVLLVPWLAGFVTYQLINPGIVESWARWWLARQDDLGFDPPSWLGATVASFAVAALLTLALSRLRRGRRPASSRSRSA